MDRAQAAGFDPQVSAPGPTSATQTVAALGRSTRALADGPLRSAVRGPGAAMRRHGGGHPPTTRRPGFRMAVCGDPRHCRRRV